MHVVKEKPRLNRIWHRSPAIHAAIIALLGLIVYSNTLSAPFQWDDKYFIAQNPLIKDLSYFIDPSKAAGSEFYGPFKGRFVGYLSFALNYRLHGTDVRGYHVVNIVIHILNALLVYLFVLLTVRTPFICATMGQSDREENNPPLPPFSKGGEKRGLLRGDERGIFFDDSSYIAFFAALLFVAHPIQTEAVTYVFQRLASLTATFYIGSLVFYARWRLSSASLLSLPHPQPLSRWERVAGGRVRGFYLLSLFFAVLAMKTKENAFTLPLVIALYEFSFFSGGHAPLFKRIAPLLPFFLTMSIVPLSLMDIEGPIGELIGGIGPATRGFEDISRSEYLMTQFRVVVKYIRLIFLPVGQNIDHDFPVSESFSIDVLFSLVFLVSLFGLAVYLFRRSLRLPAFGIFWFFITLSVESSVIPIPMVINEYRVYLPSVGFFIAVISAAFLIAERYRRLGKPLTAILIIAAIGFSYAAFKRNSLYQTEISLWQDAAGKSPLKARPQNNLGLAYYTAGESDKAIEYYQKALSLKPDYAKAHYNLGLALKAKGDVEGAIAQFEEGLRLMPGDADARFNLASLYGAKGLSEAAIAEYKKAVVLRPDFAEARFNLALAYLQKGQADMAVAHLEKVLEITPGDADARRFLDYARRGKL